LKPEFKLPTPYQLANPLLDRVYEDVMRENHRTITHAPFYSIVIDGWSNLRNDSIVTMCINVSHPVFYKSISMDGESHTAENMANIAISAIEDYGE